MYTVNALRINHIKKQRKLQVYFLHGSLTIILINHNNGKNPNISRKVQ